MQQIFIGLMSGTSLDGIDAIAIDLSAEPEILATHYRPYNDLLRQRLRRLCQGYTDELSLYAELDSLLGQLFADAALEVIDKAGLTTADIQAIGSHGQTVRHIPDHKYPNSLQIANPNIIAERTGITTITDFRRRDIAAGGQGAPLVPAFHKAMFSNPKSHRVIVNIGGIANITRLPATSASKANVTGFDTGPGNTLMDAWIQRHKQIKFDEAGRWAKRGKCNPELLNALLSDAYFSIRPPKSTGTEYFNLAWLEGFLSGYPDIPVNIQTTLSELTANTIATAIMDHKATPDEVFVCGGGSHNVHLLERLKTKLAGITLKTTAALSIEPDWVESAAFAWLAQQTLAKRHGNLPKVTGAAREVILGCIYPAG
jgi:anhydro-N-acetylmuramic acid kinase